MSKTRPYSHAFDEYLACKGLFERKRNDEVKDKFKSFINACMINNSVIEVCKSVTKYLLYGDIYKNEEDRIKYQNPLMVRKLLWKWIVVNIYLFIKPTDIHYMCLELEKFKTGIDVYSLIDLDIDDDSLYDHLLNDSNFTDKDVEAKLSPKYSKYIKNVESLVKLNYSFFSFDNRLEFYIEGRHNSKLDLVVCDVINDNKFFKFDFEILDEEEFKQNIYDEYKDKDTYIRNAITIVGLLTKYTLVNKKVFNEFILNRNKINIYTLNKDFNLSNVIKFIDGDSGNDVRKIYYKNIIPFRVKLDGVEYMIDKKGINKISTI